MDIEDIKSEVKRLVRSSLESPFVGRQLTSADLDSACDLYKRQLESLGMRDVKVKALPAYPDPRIIELEVRFTPPPVPIEMTFTVSPAVK